MFCFRDSPLRIAARTAPNDTTAIGLSAANISTNSLNNKKYLLKFDNAILSQPRCRPSRPPGACGTTSNRPPYPPAYRSKTHATLRSRLAAAGYRSVEKMRIVLLCYPIRFADFRVGLLRLSRNVSFQILRLSIRTQDFPSSCPYIERFGASNYVTERKITHRPAEFPVFWLYLSRVRLFFRSVARNSRVGALQMNFFAELE